MIVVSSLLSGGATYWTTSWFTNVNPVLGFVSGFSLDFTFIASAKIKNKIACLALALLASATLTKFAAMGMGMELTFKAAAGLSVFSLFSVVPVGIALGWMMGAIEGFTQQRC